MHFANMVICDRMADSAWLARLGRSRPNAASENQNNYVRNVMRCRYYLVAFSPFRHRAWIEGERERESRNGCFLGSLRKAFEASWGQF